MVWQRTRSIFFAIVCSSVLAFPQERETQSELQSLKVDVELVTVDVAVTDPQGRRVPGLKPEYFQLWEDKVEQKIEYFSSEDTPLSAGIIFDVSASMNSNLAVAREAAFTFLKSGNLQDEYFLVEFSDRPKVTQDFTKDISRIQSRLTAMTAKGSTSLYDAVYLGLEKLKEARNPKKALLIISDGVDNRSRYKYSDLKRFVREQDVQIYSIGIQTGYGPPASGGGVLGGILLGGLLLGPAPIEDLALMTGGQAFFPRSLAKLDEICKRIADELKNQYSIGYRSTNLTRDGGWRKLSLKLNLPKGSTRLHARFKSGYYAALSGIASNSN